MSAIASRSAPASSERIIALTGPIAAGVIERRPMPSPISAIASSVLPPISPHTPTGTPASVDWRTTLWRKRNIAGLSQS
jgi:hypothetical protein